MPFDIEFDFDCEGEPPTQFIISEGGTQLIEVFEEPVCTAEEWSWEPSDWKPGPLAELLKTVMNSDQRFATVSD